MYGVGLSYYFLYGITIKGIVHKKGLYAMTYVPRFILMICLQEVYRDVRYLKKETSDFITDRLRELPLDGEVRRCVCFYDSSRVVELALRPLNRASGVSFDFHKVEGLSTPPVMLEDISRLYEELFSFDEESEGFVCLISRIVWFDFLRLRISRDALKIKPQKLLSRHPPLSTLFDFKSRELKDNFIGAEFFIE